MGDVTRRDREAAMVAYNGPDSVGRPRHRDWIERGGNECGATVQELAQAIAAAREQGRAEDERALAPTVPAFAESLVRVEVITRTHRHEVRRACRFHATAADVQDAAREMADALSRNGGG